MSAMSSGRTASATASMSSTAAPRPPSDENAVVPSAVVEPMPTTAATRSSPGRACPPASLPVPRSAEAARSSATWLRPRNPSATTHSRAPERSTTSATSSPL